MSFLGFPILSFLIFFPLLAGLALLILPISGKLTARLAFLLSLLPLLAGIFLFLAFQPDQGMQFEEKVLWIKPFNIYYHVGIDGISLLLVVLTLLLIPIVFLSSFRQITEHERAYYGAFFILEAGVVGAFLALDLFLFYIFWELMLVPMYLIIGVWGGKRRIYAALKFFIFTAAGSFLMFLAILYLAGVQQHLSGKLSFYIFDYYHLPLTPTASLWCFLAFALAFAIKVPLIPVHTWLPDAHVEAPSGGSVILAGILLKLGTYGFIRFCIPMFPQVFQSWVPVLLLLSLAGITYGAWVSFAQEDVKKLIAFSSIAHMGFVMLGLVALTPLALSGSLLQMVNHGLSTGALFLLVGIIYERTHTRKIKDYGGIAKIFPVYTAVFLVVALSSLGLPGLNGFVGEFLILLGTFQVYKLHAIIAASGVVFAACYLLWLVRRVFFGPFTQAKWEGLPDLSLREMVSLFPLGIFIVWIGIYPSTFLSKIQPAITAYLDMIHRWLP